jgi:hypothetical protein
MSLDISTSESDSEEDIGEVYNLKSQNQKSKRNQTKAF